MIPKNRFRVSITSECNMRCVYCHNEGNKTNGYMSIDNIVNILQLAKQLNLTEIRLTGGEPLIHPKIKEICNIIKNEYDMKVSINTNLVENKLLMDLLNHNLVDHIVVGIDYFNGTVSKRSALGLPSHIILKKVIEIRRKFGNIISLATVYNGDIENITKLVDFCITNYIRIKVIERQEKVTDNCYVDSYKQMQDAVIKRYPLRYLKDEYNEINGYLNNTKVLSFFHSFCRIKRCDLCRSLQLRVTHDCKIKRCVFDDSFDFSCNDIDVLNKLLRL